MGYKKIDIHFMNELSGQWIGSLLIVLFSLFTSGQVLAAVSLSGSTQSPPNDVIAGTNVSYSMTIAATADHFISFQITDNGQSLGFQNFSADTAGCSFDGSTVFCGQQAAGTTKAYNFSWRLPPAVGTHNMDFIVNCGFQCTGFTDEITTIVRTAQPGVLQFSSTTYQGTEGAAATITVTRTGGSDGVLEADITIGGDSDTATPTDDYTPTSIAHVTFAAGVTEQTLPIQLVADTVVEGNETVSLGLIGATGVIGSPNTAVLTIIDATIPPPAGDLQFSSPTYQGTEGTTATITVTRTGGSAGVQTADIVIGATGDTATTADYTTPANTTITFADGDTTPKTIDIPLTTDALVEANETLTLTLQQAAGLTATRGIGTPSTAVLTIIDATIPPPTGDLQFSSPTYQGTEGTTATITVTRTGGSAGVQTADIVIGATGDTATTADYTTPANTTVTFTDGDTTPKTIDIPLTTDALVEGNETLSLTLQQQATGELLATRGIGTPSTAVLTIIDATIPPPTGDLQFSSATYQATEGTTATITVTRTGGSAGTQSAEIIIGGGTVDTATIDDYTPPTSTILTFADGVTTQSIDIPIKTDALVEGSETLSLTLQQPIILGGSVRGIGTPNTAVLTIIDANSSGTLGFSSDSFTASEQDGEAVIMVVRTGSPDGSLSATVEVTGDTATQNEDYQVPANLLLTWVSGDTAPKEVRIPVLADNKVEADERVNLLLKDSQGQAISAALLTITDNAPAADQVDVVSGGQQDGTSGTTLAPFAVRVLDAAGNPIEGAPVTWTIEPASGGSLNAGSETTSDAEGASSNILTLNTSSRVVVTARAAQGANQVATFIVNRAIIDTPQLTENQRRVAVALDSACAALAAKQTSGAALTAGEADLLATCNKFAAASDADIAEGLNRLAPDEISSQGTATIKAANLQVTNINSRLNALRSGVKGMSLSGLNLNIQGEAIPGSVLDAMLDGQARGGSAGDEVGGRSPWGGFINGEISFGDKDDTDREPGFDFDTTGITAGIDYRISNEVVVGGAVGYGNTESDFNDGISNMELEGWHLTGYGTYYRNDNFYIDGLAKLGWNTYDTSRRINFPGDPLQKAEGDTDSFEYSFSLTGGYEYNKDALTLGGYGRLGYTKVEIDGYSESASNPGVPGFGSVLKLADQDVDSLTTTLGGEVSYAISTSKAVFMPQLRLEWEHEFNNDERAINAQFIHDPSSTTFGVLTDEPDKDYFNVGLGFSVVTTGGKSGFLYYETRLGQDNIEQHWIKGGLRFEY